MFPAEPIPDGAVFAPHHFTYAVYLAFLLAAVAWDDFRNREPIAVVGSLGFAWFGFIHMWPYYPVWGASMVLLGLSAASVALAHPRWGHWPRWIRIGIAVMVAVAWDDAISHAFGFWTPLDWIFKAYLAGVMG